MPRVWSSMEMRDVTFGGRSCLTIRDVVDLSQGRARAVLSPDSLWRSRIDQGAKIVARAWAEGTEVYGVTTGFGDSCTVPIAGRHIQDLPRQLARFHGCGLGSHLSEEAARSVIAVRLASLCTGFSGVRMAVLEHLAALLNSGIIPLIPEEGSVGASGDLTPLSYLAAVMMGERQVFYRGGVLDASEALKKAGLEPLVLLPKETLSIMNGTAVMTGLAALACDRADYLARLAARLTSLSVVVLKGHPEHFNELLFQAKPHPGQAAVAAWVRDDLAQFAENGPPAAPPLQDRYSLRCAPHVIGVLTDVLPWMRQVVETETNSANDNPIVDAANERLIHGGHFYGGHIGFVADSLKNAVASIADLLDRQLASLIDPKFNKGLPANLSGAAEERQAVNHGLKAVQIGASAWTAEALKLTMPATSFSRSTESHNQDKVSMGTIAVRDSLRVLELTEQVAAACLIAASQALRLRFLQGELRPDNLGQRLAAMNDSLNEQFDFLAEDRPLEQDLRRFTALIAAKHWSLYGSNRDA